MDDLYQRLETEYFTSFDSRLRYLLAEYSIADLVDHIIKWLKDLDENDLKADEKYRFTLIFARDLFIGSDLSKEEKKKYYQTLKAAGFFQSLNEFLYSNNQGFCSYAIYTIGKFSQPENARYLEEAYEKEYRSVDPSLSYRCLSELSWLGSSQLSKYIDDLKNERNTFSKLTLAMFFRSRSDSNNEYDRLITDPELVNFIAPTKPNASKDELESRLANFDMQAFNSAWSSDRHSKPQRLKAAMSKFFNDFVYIKTEDEGHQNLLRAMGVDNKDF